jgi:hypothetical protein
MDEMIFAANILTVTADVYIQDSTCVVNEKQFWEHFPSVNVGHCFLGWSIA